MQKIKEIFKPSKIKTKIAVVFTALLAVYQLYSIIRQISTISKLTKQFSGLGGGLLGSLLQIEIPAQLYISIGLTIFSYALLLLLFVKFLAPIPKHRYVVLGILALYVLQGVWSLLNTNTLSNSNSIVLLILKPTELTSWYILGVVITPYLALLVGAIINKRIEWIAAIIALFWAVYFVVTSIGGEISDKLDFTLNLLSQLLLVAVLILHPVIKKPMFKRKYYDDDED